MSSSLPIPNVSTILNLEGEQNDRRKIEKLQTNYASFEKETRAYLTGNHQDDTNFQGEISGTHIPFLKSIEERINSANVRGFIEFLLIKQEGRWGQACFRWEV
eukprot:TRINITY_DN715_c0_g1_i1.p4 TRINITY_DN715_c0_g1~~TRINITY_DN715_c0_g1_i1.p4  ORF type:complete len:103 (+),score=18.83 TRINITY_DN715_c0_g1_i1:173-481(+)